MDILDLRKKSGEVSDKYIHNVKDEQWTMMSNCTEWTVKQLVNHIVNENYWEPEILAGKTIAEVDGKFEGDLVGNNPVGVWEKSIREADGYLAVHPESINKTVHLSFGDVPAEEYMSQRILDLTIHGWDVAKSTGQETTLPRELVQYLWDTFSPQEKMLADSGLFGTRIDVPQDADLQTKLLGLLGRK